MIDRQHELPVTHQAKLLKVSRGSVYYLPKPVSEADLALMRRLDPDGHSKCSTCGQSNCSTLATAFDALSMA